MQVDFPDYGGWKISVPIRHFGKKYGNLSALPIILVIFADYYATYRPNAVRRRKKNDRGNNSHRSSSKNDRDNFHSKNSVKNDRRAVTSGSRKKITASGNNQQNTGAKKKKTIRNIHKKK